MLVTDSENELGWGIQVPAVRGSHPAGRFAPGPSILGDQRVVLSGPNAVEAARLFLPRINRWGGVGRSVRDAVTLLEDGSERDAIFRRAAAPRSGEGSWRLESIARQPAHVRLAMEIAVHEATERTALEGELGALEAQWREAEEIAAIADDLTLPLRVSERLERLLDGR
jgi:hypothetical protein